MTANKKIELVTKSPKRYLLRAIFATLLLTLATVLAFLIADVVQSFFLEILPVGEANAAIAYNLAKIAYASVFGWALVMILFMNTELFTSNAMYFGSQLFSKNVDLKPSMKVLIFCYVGNFIGAVLMALLIVYSGTFTASNAAFAEHVVLAKIAKDPLTIILQGIIANMIINIAVILVLRLKDDMARITAIMGLVFIFAFLGSEHCIANFSSFSLVGFATNFANMPLVPMLLNILFATIGNLIGGGVIIGVSYAWLNQGEFKYKD